LKIKPFIESGAGVQPITITGNPLLDRIYQNRGITHADQLNHTLSKLLSPFLMKGMRDATDVLIRHILKGSRILVVGDYDCDGATATAIAVEGLSMLGAKDVRFIVPDRMVHGYGLSEPVVKLAGEYKPDLIVTVDNGIASLDGARAVYELEHPCELVITDHHLASELGVPRAEAIVNPNQPGCEFPSKAIAGCGVMLYVIIALRSRMRELGLLEQLNLGTPRIEKLLDLAALGTVADVVALDYNNRIIVASGLELMNRGEARIGINELLRIAGRKIGTIKSSDMGFAVGPRLNAAGRLSDMTHGIRMLLETNQGLATEMAEYLESKNNERKELQREMVAEANDDLVDVPEVKGIIAYNGGWHEGVIGLVASNIKERTSKPVICMTDTHGRTEAIKEEENAKSPQEKIVAKELVLMTDIKGSARSVEGIHMKHVLDAINKKAPHILYKFGGHAMAAGLTIQYQYLEIFRKMFNEEVAKDLTDEMVLGKCAVDVMDMPEEWINLNNADVLSREGPWGAKFEEPVFGGNFVVKDFRPMGTVKQHAKLFLQQVGGKKIFEAVCWNCCENGIPPFHVGNTIQCSYSLSINEFRGNTTVQLMVKHLQDPEYILDLQKKAEYEANNPVAEDFSVKKAGLQKRIASKTELTPGF
jgi:single-stranded-DNA-specific exonuclease